MALNLDKVKAKLSSFDRTKKGGKKTTSENSEKIKKYIWKPEPGKQVIRIVPSQYQPDFPFFELKWHYDLNGANYLSPCSQNKPDPIVELANRLEKSKDTWLKGRKMQPKSRTYVPIIVRGREEEGVKYWGFGVQVYEQLLSALAEPDYGDLTGITNGYDIQVDFKTKEEVNKDFPETKILIKPKPRPVIDPEHPKAKEILELIAKKQPDIFDIYQIASYDDLSAALETKLSAEKQGAQISSVPRGVERTIQSSKVENDNVTYPSESEMEKQADIQEKTTIPTDVLASSPTTEKSKSNIDDFEEAFKNIFK